MLDIRKNRVVRIGAILLLVGGVLLTIPPYRDYCETNDANQYYCAIYEIISSLFSFVEAYNGIFTAIATVAIACFTLSLREATDKLGEIATITAAKQELDTAIIQRAFLAVEPLGIEPMRTDIGQLIGIIQIRNVGRLPARHVRWFVKIKLVADGQEKEFPIGELEGNNVAAPGVVMRKGSFNSETIDEIKKDNKKEWYFYVWGTVRYFDGFTEGRYTNFCHRYNWHSFSEIGGKLSAPFSEARYHEHANDAD